MSIPYSNGTTSRAAAIDIKDHRQIQQEKIHAACLAEGLHGLTRQEITERTGISGDSVRPRVLELIEAGRLCQSGEIRRTASGRASEVLIAVDVVPA